MILWFSGPCCAAHALRKPSGRKQQQPPAVLPSNGSGHRTPRASGRRPSSLRPRLHSQIRVHGTGGKPPSQSVHVLLRSLRRDSAYFSASSIYDGHHITCMTIIIVGVAHPKGGIMKLTGKKALITGGNSGIGLATARLFVAEGAQVAITGRDQKTLDEAVAELGPNARGYRADVTVADDRKRLFADLAKDFGKLDIVFANAGISGRTPTGATDEAVFENIVHTNLNGAFFTVNSAAPLLNDNASIIFNGSVHNYIGQAGLAAYAATKGGVVSMARAIAADLAPRNIRVNVVAPGATKTPIWKRGPRASMSAEQ